MQYRKKPVVINAIKWTGWNFHEIHHFAGDNVFVDKEGDLVVRTLEDGDEKAKHVVDLNDFLIQGVQGEFYACKPDIFEATYDEV